MINLTFIEHDGRQHQVAGQPGSSIMQVAIDQGVPGIDADCGGSCACGTCHVMVASEWLSKLSAPQQAEIEMINMTEERTEGSRLACQIILDESLDGITVELPEFQM